MQEECEGARRRAERQEGRRDALRRRLEKVKAARERRLDEETRRKEAKEAA